MVDGLEALFALYDKQTMDKAATELRITQSAISKRIAALEGQLGESLLTKVGRKVELTSYALSLVQKTRPLLAQLKESLNERPLALGSIEIGFSESILASYGAVALHKISKNELKVRAHAHRGPVVIDRVLSGEYLLGICAGYCSKSNGLSLIEIGHEAMVIVGEGPKDLVTIEESSETWKSIENRVRKSNLNIQWRLESFSSMIQLAKVGMIKALVPIGIANAMNVPPKMIKKTKIKRPIILVARNSTLEREDIKSFALKIKDQISLSLN